MTRSRDEWLHCNMLTKDWTGLLTINQVLEYQGAEHCNPRAGRAGVYHVARRSTDDLRASHERRRAEYFSWLATVLLAMNDEPM